MEIILIRHGIAEDRSNDRPDETRSLTDEGRKQLERSLSGYHRLIKRKKPSGRLVEPASASGADCRNHRPACSCASRGAAGFPGQRRF